jgi:hypothetical protein
MCRFLTPPPPHIRNILYRPAWPGFLLLYRPASLPPPPNSKAKHIMEELLVGVEPQHPVARSLPSHYYTTHAYCQGNKKLSIH